MFEQFGPIYFQNASEIRNPSNATYKRLYQDLATGVFKLRLFDGTEENFADFILAGSSVGDFANIGWNEASTNMNTTLAFAIITGPPVTRQSFGGTSFVQNNPNELSIKYIGVSGARVRLELVDTHSSAATTVFNYQVFKNGIALPDSNFQAQTNVARNLGQALTIEDNVNTNDVFDIRVASQAIASPIFRSLSFIATKQK